MARYAAEHPELNYHGEDDVFDALVDDGRIAD